MLEELKEQVCDANRALVASGLVIESFGGVSGVDRPSGQMVIKPAGLAVGGMKPKDMIVTSLDSGEVVEGELAPSTDAATHMELYRGFKEIGGVAHTHSLYATAWAQAGREIPPFGTTHADYFRGPILCTRELTTEEIHTDYEANTGKIIVERFGGIDPMLLPGMLVRRHGPFVWGSSPSEAARHAEMVEYLAKLATKTISIEPYPNQMPVELLNKHFLRRHGSSSR